MIIGGDTSTSKIFVPEKCLTMHELLLFAQVPAARQDQLLKILAGIAGMSPQDIFERHVIFRPKRAPGSKATPIGASQGVQSQHVQAIQSQLKGELFYLQLVSDITKNFSARGNLPPRQLDHGDEDSNTIHGGVGGNVSSGSWSLCFFDLPEVGGRRSVTSRMISSVDILDGDPMAFMDALGYRYARSSSLSCWSS